MLKKRLHYSIFREGLQKPKTNKKTPNSLLRIEKIQYWRVGYEHTVNKKYVLY